MVTLEYRQSEETRTHTPTCSGNAARNGKECAYVGQMDGLEGERGLYKEHMLVFDGTE